MPAVLDAANVYAASHAGNLTGAARRARHLVYVPNSGSDTLTEIDPATDRVVRTIRVGGLPQHVVPSWDLRTLYVTNDAGNSLTAIDPATGRVERTISVRDPYNLYFTPNGRSAIVVAEALRTLDFRDPHTFRLQHALHVPGCAGVDHLDFSLDGRFLVASCEFSGRLIEVNVQRRRVIASLTLEPGAMPQDVKLAPDGSVFFVADLTAGGVHVIDAARFREIAFLRTGAGAHGLYPSRDGRSLYVSNRTAGTVSVISFAHPRVVRTWAIPGGGSPDMGGVSANGKVLWLAGRYDGVVYAIDVRRWRLLAEIPVGAGPHGVCVWPQPGRYSLGHTGIMR
jgi:YVTN family beta-propeller protein